MLGWEVGWWVLVAVGVTKLPEVGFLCVRVGSLSALSPPEFLESLSDTPVVAFFWWASLFWSLLSLLSCPCINLVRD